MHAGTIDINALVRALDASSSGCLVVGGALEAAGATSAAPPLAATPVLAGVCADGGQPAAPLPVQLSNASELSAASGAQAGQPTGTPTGGAAAASPTATNGGGWLWGDSLPVGAFAGLPPAHATADVAAEPAAQELE